MTPLAIRIALHYYWSPEQYRDVVDHAHGSSEAVKEIHSDLCSAKLLTLDSETRDDRNNLVWTYHKTAGLDLYVEALMKVPLPELRWVMPEPPA